MSVKFDSDFLRKEASRLVGYVKVRVDVQSALALARLSPRPDTAQLTIMKGVSNSGFVTLEQVRAVLGLSAQKALRNS